MTSSPPVKDADRFDERYWRRLAGVDDNGVVLDGKPDRTLIDTTKIKKEIEEQLNHKEKIIEVKNVFEVPVGTLTSDGTLLDDEDLAPHDITAPAVLLREAEREPVVIARSEPAAHHLAQSPGARSGSPQFFGGKPLLRSQSFLDVFPPFSPVFQPTALFDDFLASFIAFFATKFFSHSCF